MQLHDLFYSILLIVVVAGYLLARRIKHTDLLYEERHQRFMERLDEIEATMLKQFDTLELHLKRLNDNNKQLMLQLYYKDDLDRQLEGFRDQSAEK